VSVDQCKTLPENGEMHGNADGEKLIREGYNTPMDNKVMNGRGLREDDGNNLSMRQLPILGSDQQQTRSLMGPFYHG